MIKSGITKVICKMSFVRVLIYSNFAIIHIENTLMQAQIIHIQQKKLIGRHLQMSLADHKTYQLWHSFMKEIKAFPIFNSRDKFSLQLYDESLRLGDMGQKFEKWAAVEVSNDEVIPDNMEVFIIPAGRYAVFHYQGLSTDHQIYIDIFTSWLPQSSYVLDDRPHFEILGQKYKNDDPQSEEDIWIPIKAKEETL
jgi:AraC family transcriptional regulator